MVLKTLKETTEDDGEPTPLSDDAFDSDESMRFCLSCSPPRGHFADGEEFQPPASFFLYPTFLELVNMNKAADLTLGGICRKLCASPTQQHVNPFNDHVESWSVFLGPEGTGELVSSRVSLY